MADLSLSGLASGFDWKTVVDQLTDIERAPQRRLLDDQFRINQQSTAVSSLVTELESLKSKTEILAQVNLFSGAGTAKSSNDVYATASASTKSPLGTYKFGFTQLATAAVRKGDTDAGGSVDTAATLTGTDAAGFAVPVTAGFFTLNGKQITIDGNTTLGTDGSADTDTIINKINNSGAGVTATYDAVADKITLSSGSNIVLGGAGDTSNFLQAARLDNSQSSSSTIVSSKGIGGVNLSTAVSSINFNTALNPTTGNFKINGVSIAYAASDTMTDIFERINNSGSGVTAAYDSANDQFSLTNNSTGDVGIALEDTTGNFLAATKLLSGTTTAGLNATYTINGGSQLESLSNTITEISHGITGLIISAHSIDESAATTNVTITVGSDDSGIKKAITGFVDQYNKIQSLIDTQTASSTDAKGKVTRGILSNDTTISEVTRTLRAKMFLDVGVSSTIKRLETLGFETDGNSNQITLADESKLDTALSTNKNDLKLFFTDSSDGLAVRVQSYLESTSGLEGSLVAHKDNIAKESTRIDEQIVAMEIQVQINRQRLIDSFVAMETAQSTINQQMQFLTQRFG